MLKARNKKISLILVLAMVMTMFAGLGTAVAASTYSVNQVVKASSPTPDGVNYSNRIVVEMPKYTLKDDGVQVLVSLPKDFKADWSVGGFAYSGNQVSEVFVDGGTGPVNAKSVLLTVYQSVYQGDLGKSGVFYIDLDNIQIPSGKDGDVNVTFEAPQQSPFSPGKVTVATIGSGKVDLAIEDVATITSDGNNAIETLILQEDRAGAFGVDETIELKLPVGFTWDKSVATAESVWGTEKISAASFSLKDSDRTLVIKKSVADTTPAYLKVHGLKIKVDESVAKLGDVVASVGGKTSTNVNELTVANYGEIGFEVKPVGEPKTVIAGRFDQEIGSFAINEIVEGSLVEGRSVTLELIGNAKWYEVPKIDNTESKNVRLNKGWTPIGTDGKIIKTSANNGTLRSDNVFSKGSIVVAPSAAMDKQIKIKVSGTNGVTGEVVVANVVPPVIGTAEVTDVRIGVNGQQVKPVIISEFVKEGIDARVIQTGPSEYTSLNNLMLVFPDGVKPTTKPTFKVLEGDLQLDNSSVQVNKLDDGRWYAAVTVRSTSMTPAKIEMSNLALDVDRTVAEGDIELSITGSAVNQTISWFPGDTRVGAVKIANAVTPAPGDVAKVAVFKYGETTYTLNGAPVQMDVAPYAKNNRTYVPVRYCANALGISDNNIIWDQQAKTVTMMKGDKVVQLKLGSNIMKINGVDVRMDVVVEAQNGRTFLPAAWVAQAFGAQAVWDPADPNTVTVSY